MFHVLLDTCVWLKLAEDYRQTPLLQVVRGAIDLQRMKLILPRQVVDEFRRARPRVVKTAERSYASHFLEIRRAIDKVGGDKRKRNGALKYLADVQHKLPQLGRPVETTLDEVEALFAKAEIIEASEHVLVAAGRRALHRKAPCHTEKNSMGDAVILETYIEQAANRGAGRRYAFVTDNYTDFSVPNGNRKMPHPDFASHFSKIRSMYFTNLAECLRKVDGSFVSEVEWFAAHEEARGISDLMREHELLFDQVWYNRHKYHEWEIATGKVKVVTKAQYDKLVGKDRRNHNKIIVDQVWELGKAAAKRVEAKRGLDKLGPWTDFEWGMVNGKLSAVRWMLGDEWDMLDT
jgi:hypothetical protein